MAYRRKHGTNRASTFKEEIYDPPNPDDNSPSSPALGPSYSFSSSNSSLAAKAIRASAANRESIGFDQSRSKGFNAYEDPSKNEPKGFWGVLAQKAKAIIDEENEPEDYGPRSSVADASIGGQFQHSYQANEGLRKMDNPTLRRGLDKLTSSLNQIGDSFEKAFEEGRTIVETKTADIIQETRKFQMRQKGGFEAQNQPGQDYQTNHETQLKASRDVALATAAKAKLLLRELKTIKADLAFAKERGSQLEEENKRLRENRDKGSNFGDDDLVRLQLETLLAEKARLAHENSIYARENRFLREIVEYHQLTMQDVVYIDEGIEEVTEVNPSLSRTLSVVSSIPSSPPSPGVIQRSASAIEIYLSSEPQLVEEASTGHDIQSIKRFQSEIPRVPKTSVPEIKSEVKRPPQPPAH